MWSRGTLLWPPSWLACVWHLCEDGRKATSEQKGMAQSSHSCLACLTGGTSVLVSSRDSPRASYLKAIHKGGWVGLFTNHFLMLPSHPRHHPLSAWPRHYGQGPLEVSGYCRASVQECPCRYPLHVPWPLLMVLGATDHGHLPPPSYVMASEPPSFILFVAFCKPSCKNGKASVLKNGCIKNVSIHTEL